MASSEYAHGAYAERKKNFNGEDYDRNCGEYIDSVSDLSSYRFVSDEDELSACIVADIEIAATEENSNNKTRYYKIKRNNNSSNNNNNTEQVGISTKNRRVSSTAPSGKQTKAHTNTCSVPAATPSSRSSSSPVQTSVPLPTLLSPAAVQATKATGPRRASPTICCYTIDKPVSIHYNATILEYIPNEITKTTLPTPTPGSISATAPVPIPLTNTDRSIYRLPPEAKEPNELLCDEVILSTSLPSDYGSVKGTVSQYQLAQCSSRKNKPKPPEPPPKPKQEGRTIYQTTIYSSSNALTPDNRNVLVNHFHNGEQICSNGQNIQSKLKKFEQSTSLAGGSRSASSISSVNSKNSGHYTVDEFHNTEERWPLSSRSLERSVSPEHCQLLSCFGTVKNTRDESASIKSKTNENKNDEQRTDDARRSNDTSRPSEDRLKRNEQQIYNDKETKTVARSLSESSCLVSVATPIANEKCAIKNKNNHQQQHQPHEILIQSLIPTTPPSSAHHHNKINNNINNKRRNCGDSEQIQRSAANRKESASTSVYTVATVSDGARDDLTDTFNAYTLTNSAGSSACGECNNNYNCKTRCHAEYSYSPISASTAYPFTAVSAESSRQSSQSSVSYLSSPLPKHTLRYDSYGRLKSERVSRLPTTTRSLTNGRKAASETRLHRTYQNVSVPPNYDIAFSLSATNVKLTPILCRKFNYLSDKFEDCVVESEEVDGDTCVSESANEQAQKGQGIEETVQNRDENNVGTEQISSVKNTNTTKVLPSTTDRHDTSRYTIDNNLNLNFTKTIPPEQKIYKSLSDTQNFVSNHKEGLDKTNNISEKRFFSDYSLAADFAEADCSLPCQCSSKKVAVVTGQSSPVSPTSLTLPISLQPPKSSGALNHKNSQSLPSVPQSNGTQSPLWLSTEAIGSPRLLERKPILDDVQSNCSDQTTIFHFDKECSLSATSLSSTSQLAAESGGSALHGPVVLKRIPAIHSFGHIPSIGTCSESSANARESAGKEINMEKRRNTLDRFQRLGFGRKSTPASSSASTESSGSSRNRKSNEKSEKLRELTELLRGNRSSPTPPPIPPPRKPRSGSHSASNSLERADTQVQVPAGSSSFDGAGQSNSFMSSRIDDIMLMDHEEKVTDLHVKPNVNTKQSNDNDFAKQSNNVCGKSNACTTVGKAENREHSIAQTNLLRDTLKPNTSLSNFESLMLMSREKSKSPPPKSSANIGASSSVNVGVAQLADSSDIATKLTRPESRTVIGSYTQKGIPFRSASFSQIDLSSGKYKKSSWSALRDRLWRDKVVGSVDSTTHTKKASGEQTTEAWSPAVGVEGKVKSEPDWIYIPLKKKAEMSINLNYGQDMSSLENVIESPDTIPEEDIFNTDLEHAGSITEDCKEMILKHNLVIAHAKMESLTDTIQSENDYAIEQEEVAVSIEPVPAVVDAEKGAVEKVKILQQPTILEPINADAMEPNVATLMEERIPLESPPDNFLQTATTCLIPVPVFECAAQDWGLENPPQEWVEVQPEEFGIIPETIEPLLSLSDCVNVKPVPKTAQEYRVENLPTISVSRSSEEADEKCILRRKDTFDEEFSDPMERRQASIDTAELSKRYSHDDIDVGMEKRASLDAITTRHSADDRKRIDKSKRRKGMYIDNAAWSEAANVEAHNRGLALDISLANFNAIKPDATEECGMMYINSPPTDDNRTPGSLYSPEISTPETDKPLVWTKADRLTSFSLQSSEEKDDAHGINVSGGSGDITMCSLSRSNKSFPFLRTDSVSDNESDRGAGTSRDRASPSPIPGDYDFKRYSKRPLRGPYGQMLEKEMKKPNKMHFEEILEDLRESEISSQPRRLRAACGDSNNIKTNPTRNIPHHSNSMRVRKSNTFLPVPAHTRAASTPSQMENVNKSGGAGSLEKINAHEKRYQSTLDNSMTSDDKDYLDAGHHYPHHLHHQREVKRAASEAPVQKSHHSKRSQSMGGEKTISGNTHIAHQAKRSLDATTGNAKAKSGTGKNSNVVPSQELLAELLKGSSEKLISEQRQQMAADTRTHVVQEILRNEQSYVESLQTIVTKYFKVLKSPEHAGMIDTRTVDEIFFMVPDILEIHEKFLADLKSRWDSWEATQKVGDVFLETFSKLEVLEVYTSFVNNCNRAKNAIRSTKHQRPSFAKFLEMTAREHKGKLTLDNLLIKPVQKFPNYEMLFQRLIKHTDRDHPDQKHLQDVLKLVHDILVHINCKEREILENGQREATLRELEGVIEGITDLITPDRQFLLFDLVSMPSGQGARKERGFFLFNDLLVLTSIKKRSGTIRKPNPSTCPGTVASTLDTNKYKFLTKISLDCLEIVKTKDENVKRIMNEIENLAEDCNKLQQIADITASLKYPHQYLEDVIRELLRDVQRQLSERQTNDAQLNMLELLVNSPNGSQKLSIVFSKAEKRTQWEETFNEAKQKLAATLERHPIPEFLMSIPIRKTRAGLQFTCAAATLSEKRDVWVCNSDGYVGQVCIMSLYPEPNVTSCNGVCNARILCVASVPAYNPNVVNSAGSGTQLQQPAQQAHPRSASTTPQHSYTQQLRDYRKSISPNFQPPITIGTPEKKKTPSASVVGTVNATAGADNANGEPSADNQLDLNLSSSDDETDTGIIGGCSVGAVSSNGSGTIERVPSPAPSTQTVGSVTLPGSSSSGTPSHHSHQDSNPDEGDGNLSTMWIGTEDGCIHVYNSTDNIRIKKNRIKIEHQSAVYSILYLDNRVFVSLANGDICVYLRDGVAWNTSSSHCLSIGSVTSPVTKLLNVHGKLWCSIQGIIKVLDTETLLVVNQIQISSDSKPITNMTVSNNYVWISIQNSAHIKCFHSMSHQLIAEVNLAPAVNKMLSNCDEIIRQHKAACLRVTSLLSCRDLIWIGTSAGVLLTIPAQGFEKGVQSVVPTGIPHGHTGHVRFLTFVETSGLSAEGSGSSTGSAGRENEGAVSSSDYRSQSGAKHSKPKSESSTILVISGGDGYEDFRNSGANSLSEIAGREDSTNHLLIWQI